MPVGVSVKKEVPFTNYEIDINKGDLLYLFTDGYYDQFERASTKRLTKQRFKNKLIELAYLSLQEQKDNLQKYFDDWRGDSEQIDDVTVIGIRI
jgi:serine phosphatase RsbU (regulator of sigma subunit)